MKPIVLTLENILTPPGFASLAAAVAGELKKHGLAVLYLGEGNTILHKDAKTEVALVQSPALVADPRSVLEMNPEKDTITLRLSHIMVVDKSVILYDEQTPHASGDKNAGNS